MRFKLFSSIFVLTLLFSACSTDLLDQVNEEDGISLRKAAVSSIVWKGDTDKAVAVNIAEAPSARKNASGTKITSNAHSADFPGIYFIWDSKQKDNGYLKVEATVFDAYESFTLTSKESNTYWDFVIKTQPGQQKTDDNCYVFFIPKVYNNKNINMVFIEGFVERTTPTIPEKPFIEGDDCLKTYTLISGAYNNGFYVVDPDNLWTKLGPNIKVLWNEGIGSSPLYGPMMAIQTQAGQKAEWIWDRMDSWETGFTGSNIINTVSNININGEIVEDEVLFYFACDNAAVVFVNGQLAGYTVNAFINRAAPPQNASVGFTDFSNAAFDGEAWRTIDVIDIKGFLKDGANEIIVVAANSDDNNGRYNIDNNPAGLIYACQFTTSTCPPEDNDPDPETEPIVVNLGFIGYYLNDGNVLSTSIHWQNLEEGDMIDWDAVDAAYAEWVAGGGLAPKRELWQTSGYASFTFDDYAALGFGDFNIGQLENYYKAYYVDPGYILVEDTDTDLGDGVVDDDDDDDDQGEDGDDQGNNDGNGDGDDQGNGGALEDGDNNVFDPGGGNSQGGGNDQGSGKGGGNGNGNQQ